MGTGLLLLGALGVLVAGASVSQSTTACLSIPAISLLSLPERELSGSEIRLELSPAGLAPGLLFLEVKSNVPWAVTAQLLCEERADLLVQVLDGPEVVVTAEALPILTGRPGKHGVWLFVKICQPPPSGGPMYLVLQVAGALRGPALSERG